MIDIHAHILPGVDDGPTTLAEALEMVRIAEWQGVSRIVATPHHMPHRYDAEMVEPAYMQLLEAIQDAGLSVSLSLGNEVPLSEEGMEAAEVGVCRSLASTRSLLVELPWQRLYPVHEDWLHRLGVRGFQVVLAHVDRYPYLMEKPELFRRLLVSGAVCQLNASALVEKATRRDALAMIRNGFAHVAASDCHGAEHRPSRLRDARQIVAAELGEAVAKDMFSENPRRLLAGEPVVKEWTNLPQERKGLLGWLKRT